MGKRALIALALFAIAGCETIPVEAVVCDDTANPDCAPSRPVGVE